jgi:hypothetical protein
MAILWPIIGLFGITAAVLGGERLASNIPVPKTPSNTNLGGIEIPWYVPVAAVAVGGVLLYKYGAKKLHV